VLNTPRVRRVARWGRARRGTTRVVPSRSPAPPRAGATRARRAPVSRGGGTTSSERLRPGGSPAPIVHFAASSPTSGGGLADLRSRSSDGGGRSSSLARPGRRGHGPADGARGGMYAGTTWVREYVQAPPSTSTDRRVGRAPGRPSAGSRTPARITPPRPPDALPFPCASLACARRQVHAQTAARHPPRPRAARCCRGESGAAATVGSIGSQRVPSPERAYVCHRSAGHDGLRPSAGRNTLYETVTEP
jgi:hypothetical protein